MLNLLNQLLSTAIMPMAGDSKSAWPYILIGVAVILIIVILVINKNKK